MAKDPCLIICCIFCLLSCLLAGIIFPSYVQAQDIKYRYDSLNRLIRAEYPNGQAIEYSYDHAGNRFSKIVQKGSMYNPNGSITLGANEVIEGGDKKLPIAITARDSVISESGCIIKEKTYLTFG